MINRKERDILYKRLTFLDQLSVEEQDLIVGSAKKLTYEKGVNIHGGRNSCSGIIIPISGSLRIYMLSENGKEITLYRLEEGELCILSASCVLNDITFDVHMDSDIESEVLIVDLVELEKMSNNIYVENFMLKETVTRFSDVMWAMEKILFLKLDERLAVFLLDEIARNNSLVIGQTHDQIAKHLGSAREAVSRMLNNFARDGLVELSRGEVKVIDKEILRQLSL